MTDFELKSQRCSRCMLSFPLHKDKNTCHHCTRAFSFSCDEKKILWQQQLELFLNFQTDLGQGTADAIVLWSGGSDSTLTLYEAKYTLNLRVIALQFECFFERLGMQEAAGAFLKKHQIPLITMKADIRAMFHECHAGEQQISEQCIADFPWDVFHASGDRSFVWKGAQIVARYLNIRRVICGNNLIEFNPYTPRTHPNTFGDQFINAHLDLLNPIRILLVYPDHILLHLPMAMGLTKEKKLKRLKEIGYQLPDYCYTTTESDTELGLLLSAISKKWYPTKTYIPYASAFGEFLSEYITREQWLEELIKVNTYTADDIDSATQRLRDLITQDKLNSDISITVNDAFQGLFNGRDIKPVMNEILIELTHNQKLLMTEQLIRMGKPAIAATHAKKALELRPWDRESHLYLGISLLKAADFGQALYVFGQARLKFPKDFEIRFQEAVAHYHMKTPEKALALLDQMENSIPGPSEPIRRLILDLREACKGNTNK